MRVFCLISAEIFIWPFRTTTTTRRTRTEQKITWYLKFARNFIHRIFFLIPISQHRTTTLCQIQIFFLTHPPKKKKSFTFKNISVCLKMQQNPPGMCSEFFFLVGIRDVRLQNKCMCFAMLMFYVLFWQQFFSARECPYWGVRRRRRREAKIELCQCVLWILSISRYLLESGARIFGLRSKVLFRERAIFQSIYSEMYSRVVEYAKILFLLNINYAQKHIQYKCCVFSSLSSSFICVYFYMLNERNVWLNIIIFFCLDSARKFSLLEEYFSFEIQLQKLFRNFKDVIIQQIICIFQLRKLPDSKSV